MQCAALKLKASRVYKLSVNSNTSTWAQPFLFGAVVPQIGVILRPELVLEQGRKTAGPPTGVQHRERGGRNPRTRQIR
jgi:hypothetical protein